MTQETTTETKTCPACNETVHRDGASTIATCRICETTVFFDESVAEKEAAEMAANPELREMVAEGNAHTASKGGGITGEYGLINKLETDLIISALQKILDADDFTGIYPVMGHGRTGMYLSEIIVKLTRRNS